MSSNYCICCNKEIPDGSHVCSNCMLIAKDDRKFLAQVTLKELDDEIMENIGHLNRLLIRRNIFKNAMQ